MSERQVEFSLRGLIIPALAPLLAWAFLYGLALLQTESLNPHGIFGFTVAAVEVWLAVAAIVVGFRVIRATRSMLRDPALRTAGNELATLFGFVYVFGMGYTVLMMILTA